MSGPIVLQSILPSQSSVEWINHLNYTERSVSLVKIFNNEIY